MTMAEPYQLRPTRVRGFLVTLAVIWACIIVTFWWDMSSARQGHNYWSPDNKISLRVERGWKVSSIWIRPNRVYLVGRRGDEDASDYIRRVRVGAFAGNWPLASIAWVNPTTVNVCPLAGDRKALVSVEPTRTNGLPRSYAITTDCRRARRAPRTFAVARPS